MSRTLVIVDVQKEFDEYIQHDLVENLSKYAEKFDNVYQIWDTHEATGPTHSFPGQIDSIPKRYGNKHFSEEVSEYIEKIENSSEEGRTFKLSDGAYIVRVKNNHDWFYVNLEIVDLISNIKEDEVILVGGADGECLEDVYQTFKAFGINAHINKKYTYNAKTSQENSIQERTIMNFSDFILENNSDGIVTKIYYRNGYTNIKPDNPPKDVRQLDAFLVANNLPKCIVKAQGGYYKILRSGGMAFVIRALYLLSFKEWYEVVANENFTGNL